MYSDQTKDMIHTVCKNHGLNEIDANIVEMAIREASQNALKNGTRFGKESFFDLKLSVNDIAVVAVIISRGKVIDFDHIKAFDIQNDFMAYKNGGLGIPLIKALMDEVLD